MTAIKKAVILAAGLGMRMLPATKAIPKEMLPVVDRPLIQYAVEEAAAAGMDEIVLVIAEGKEAIREHFAPGGRVEAWARERRDAEALAAVTATASLASLSFVLQDRPLGIAQAIACARQHLEGGPFALVFPDDLIMGARPCLAQLAGVHATHGGTVLAVQQVAEREVSSYGIVDPAGEGNPVRVRGVVEKPTPAEAPSRLGIVGRYILGASIFAHIDRLVPGKGGELQITDAIAGQVRAGEPVWGFAYEGRRFDTGRPLGLLEAGLAMALERPALRGPMLEKMAALASTYGAN